MKYERIKEVAAMLRERAIRDGHPSPYRLELKDSQGGEAIMLYEDDSDRLTGWPGLGDVTKLIGEVRVMFIAADNYRYPVHRVLETA